MFEALEGLKLIRTIVSCFQAVLLEVRIHAMMTSWEDVGCSEGMEADLDDSFRFLSCFVLVSQEDFGCS